MWMKGFSEALAIVSDSARVAADPTGSWAPPTSWRSPSRISCVRGHSWDIFWRAKNEDGEWKVAVESIMMHTRLAPLGFGPRMSAVYNDEGCKRKGGRNVPLT